MGLKDMQLDAYAWPSSDAKRIEWWWWWDTVKLEQVSERPLASYFRGEGGQFPSQQNWSEQSDAIQTQGN